MIKASILPWCSVNNWPRNIKQFFIYFNTTEAFLINLSYPCIEETKL